MADPTPTLAEGVTLVEGGQPITPATFNHAAKWINRQQGVSGPRQIVGEPRQRGQGVGGAAGLLSGIVVDLGDDTGLWLKVRMVTDNEAGDGFDIGAEEVLVKTRPGFQDTERFFGSVFVDDPPTTLTDTTILPQDLIMSDGILWIIQTERWEHEPQQVDAERTDCGGVDL